jgi:hypothetical protein
MVCDVVVDLSEFSAAEHDIPAPCGFGLSEPAAGGEERQETIREMEFCDFCQFRSDSGVHAFPRYRLCLASGQSFTAEIFLS